MKLKRNDITSVEVIPRTGHYDDALSLFESLDIELSICGAGSFSIETTVGRLEDLFGVRLRRTKNGMIKCVYDDGTTGWKFPVERLGHEALSMVEAVSFSPIDFGPVDF